MKSKNRLKLSIAMIVCAILITLAISTVDYFKHKQFIMDSHAFVISQIEEVVADSVMTVEKAYAIFDQQTESRMQSNTRSLIEMYQTAPQFDDWDFAELKEELGMDIYIINDENVITHSSLASDIGLDFNACCQSLAHILDGRREAGKFYIDRMDLEQETGLLKMYSYMATPDNNYLIQLGYDLQDDEIFEEFNFLTMIEDLLEKHNQVNDIHVLNLGGLALGEAADDVNMTKERRAAFNKALESGETIEVEDDWAGDEALYRYIPYSSSYDNSTSQQKIIEIIYNDHDLQSLLKENRNFFISQIVIILAIIFTITIVIHRWVSKQVYFAYHDSLTKLKNRAAFDDYLSNELSKLNRRPFAFIMLDLDNFKVVNDYLGHDKGDYLLRLISQSLKKSLQGREEGEVFRLGGDEFVIILPYQKEKEVKAMVDYILGEIEHEVQHESELMQFNITASVGISLAPKHGADADALYKKADIALYRSKEKGKNQYCFYDENLIRDKII